jgi:hypothetical protein
MRAKYSFVEVIFELHAVRCTLSSLAPRLRISKVVYAKLHRA